jgi:hypothetical protein
MMLGILPLQSITPSVASAAETGTWIDGDMPELSLGDKLDNPTPATCTPVTFYQFTHIWPNGAFDKDGHQQPVDVCAVSTGYGQLGKGDGSQYIRPGTVTAFKVASSIGGITPSIVPLGDTHRFYFAPVVGSGPATSLGIYDGPLQAGEFGLYNNQMMYRLTKVHDHYLKDAAGTYLTILPGTSISENGQWMVVQVSSMGFVRINTETREMLLFTTESYSYLPGLQPTVYTAISNDGNTVIKSGTVDTKLYDLSGCQPAPFTMGPKSNTTTGCRSRLTGPDLRAKHSYFSFLLNMRFSPDGKSISGVGAVFNPSLGRNEFYSAKYSLAGYEQPEVTYMALGDSFSSGEGSKNTYILGTDEDGKRRIGGEPTLEDILNGVPAVFAPTNICHLSPKSYPYLAATSLAISAADFHNVACSGAVADDYNFPQDNQGLVIDSPLGNWQPGYRSQRNYFALGKPSVVTISIIGNDIGFSNKISRCLMPDSCFHFKEDRQSIVEEIHSKFDKLVDLYQDILRDSGGAKVYVLGYPQLFAMGSCKLNVSLDLEERQMAAGMLGYLNAVIKAATEKAGVQYIDVEQAFAGHQLCGSGTEAANGLVSGNDIMMGLVPVALESFHPNALGHQKLSEQLLFQSQYFARPMPVADASKKAPYTESTAYEQFVNSAPSGGVLKKAAYIAWDAGTSLLRGATYPLTYNDQILKPNSTYQAFFYSEPTYAGTVNTNGDGKIDGTITIPHNLSPGFHTLHIFAEDVASQPVDLYQTIYVAASEDDLDGDGIPNSQEKCLAVEPANVDEDRDGVDDACDAEIAELPTDSAPPTVIGTPDRDPNSNGWYNNNVTINWAATDPDPSSGVPTQPAATVASQEGTHTYVSDPSCDPLNNCTTGSLELKIDKTTPDISYSLSPAPNGSGWNNSSVTVTFTCSDATSGVADCTEPQTVRGADGTYVLTGSATDNAGNTDAVNVFVSLDSTSPTVTQSVSPTANAYGWHNTDVTVTSACNDNLSGLLACSPPVTLSAEGADQLASTNATDNAGNTATASTNINIDKTAPLLGAPVWSNNPKSVFGTATITLPVTENLSGIAEAEYYLGDTDPGQGNGATMQVSGGTISVNFNTDFPTGVYKVTIRVKDKAGNWSQSVSDYLVVYDPFGTRMTGKKTLLPSLANGDTLPGLIANDQQDKVKFGFNVRYDSNGSIHRNSDFQFKYETGTKCSKQTLAQNCHSLELNATSIAWLTTQGANDSTGIFQGTAKLDVDGVKSNVIFCLTGVDGERLDVVSDDHLTLKVYADGTNPNTSAPLYQVSQEVLRGNIKIRKW